MSIDNKKKTLYITKASEKSQARAQEAIETATKDPEKEKLDQKYQNFGTSSEAKAATYFAAGKNKLGLKSLVEKLNKSKGQAGLNTWYMLLDGYEIDGNKKLHDKLSTHFVKRFHMSAPQFHPYKEQAINSKSFGRNVLKIEGLPCHLTEMKKNDFKEAAKNNKTARLDLLNAELEHDDDGGISSQVLVNIMSFLRKNSVDSILIGDMNVANKLEEIVSKNRNETENIQKNDIYFWDLYLEILQWRQNEDKFEEIALEYALLFEISPNSFSFNSKTETQEVSDNFIQPETEILNINNLKKEMQNQVYQQPTVYIDFINVKRITIEAATNLKDFIKELKITKDNVIINQPNQIVKTIFEMTGLEDITTIIEKKR